MAFHEQFTIKSLLSEVNLILDTENCDKNFWFVKKKLFRVVEICRNGGDKGIKGLGIKFWKDLYVAQGKVGQLFELVRSKSRDFGKIEEFLWIVKDCVQNCVDNCFRQTIGGNWSEVGDQDVLLKHCFNFQDPLNIQTKDLLEILQKFYSSVSSNFSTIHKNLSNLNESLQKLLQNFEYSINHPSIPISSLESKPVDLQTKLKALESENLYLESTLKSTKDLLSSTKLKNDNLNSIVLKAKEKLQILKTSNTQKIQYSPNKTAQKPVPTLIIQKPPDTIFIATNKNTHSHSIKSLIDLLSSLQLQINSENLEKSEKFLKIQNFFKEFSEKFSILEKDLNTGNILKSKTNNQSKNWTKNEYKQSIHHNMNNNYIISKLLSKKNKIKLHKEQILVLKERIRELQKGLELAKASDFLHLRELWWSFAKEIPVLDKKIEETFSVFTRMLGFSSKDILSLNNERTLKKPRMKFGLF